MLRKLANSEITNPERWHRLPTLKRLTIHPGDAVRILTAACKTLPRPDLVPLQQKLIPYVRRHIGVSLPPTLPLPLPTQSKRVCRQVRYAFRTFLKRTRLPRLIQEYLVVILRVVPSPVCKLGRVLIESHIPHSISDMSTILRDEACCGCHGPPRDSRSCQRQLLFHPGQMRAVFGAQHTPLLTTCANAYTRPGSVLIHTRARHNLRAVCRKIPKTRPFPFKSFSAHVHRLLSADARDRSRKNLPSARDVRDFRAAHPQHRAVTLDKNTLCFVVVCYAFWLRILLKAYHDRPEYCHHYTAATADVMQDVLILYYVILCATLPVFKRVQPRTSMRTKLNKCLPWVEGLRLPPLTLRAPTPGCVAAYDAFRVEAFSLAVTWYNDLSQRARARGAGPPDALHTSPRAPRSWKVPSTTSTLKQKSVARVDPEIPLRVDQVSTREIFQHAGHPMAPTLKQGGRMVQLMERAYTLSFVTLNILDQRHLISGFIEPAREFFREHNIPVGAGELDLSRMFPSLNRDRIIDAHKRLAARYAKMCHLHRGTKELHFSVARTKDKKLDAIGIKGTNCWRVFSMSEARDIIFADLFLNDFFCMGDTCNRQCEGAAIGGYLSAQNADITLMAAEADVPWGSTLPSRVNLVSKVARFRDNIMFFCPLPEVQFWAHQLTLFLQDIYHMELDVEQLGRSVTFLEVQIECRGCDIHYGLKNKVLLGHMTTQPTIKRYPHPGGDLASFTVRGMAHAFALKSLQIASSPAWVESNFAQSFWELSQLYPTSWWEELLRQQYRKAQGVVPWTTLKEQLLWFAPVPPKFVLLDPDAPLPTIPLRTFDIASLRTHMHASVPLLGLRDVYDAPDIYVPPDYRTSRPQHVCRIPKIRRPPPERPRTPEAPRSRRQRPVSNATPAAQPSISAHAWGSLWHRISAFLNPLPAQRLALTCRFALLCGADALPGHQRLSQDDPSLPHLAPLYWRLSTLARRVFSVISYHTVLASIHALHRSVPCELLHIVSQYASAHVPCHPMILYLPLPPPPSIDKKRPRVPPRELQHINLDLVLPTRRRSQAPDPPGALNRTM